MVKLVPKVKPAMMETASPTQKTSCIKGITPSTVVAAANALGVV